MKINGSKTVLIVWSLSSIDGMLLIYLYFFPLSIMQKSLKSIYVPSIPIKLFVRERKWWSLIFFRHQYFSWKKNVYRKKTFSGVYSNFNSFISESYKTGLIESLLFRCFNLCSDFVKFNDEINIFKSILYKNSNPRDLVDKKFLDRVSTQKVVVSTVPKMDLMIVLPYLGKFSLQIPTRINRVMKNKLPQKINLQVDQFLHIHRLNSYFLTFWHCL